MNKVIIMSKNARDIARVYSPRILGEIKTKCELYPITITKSNISEHLSATKEAEYIFSTWGMETFSVSEIKEYFPRLKGVFYAAGSVQHFAKEFLECGVNVYSAWQANAAPVAEFTYAQILLANKGYFTAQRKCKLLRALGARSAEKHGGNYYSTIGIIGCGMIGGMVCESLNKHNCEVLVYDPYLTAEKIERLKITQVDSLEEIFKRCDVISNHLANKEELTKILNYKLFHLMKPYATFINTGRGRQVDEKGLIKALREQKSRVALLDVTFPEPPNAFSGLLRRRNMFLTPHIAGSLGREVERMSEYMLDEYQRVIGGEEPKYKVTVQMLSTMA